MTHIWLLVEKKTNFIFCAFGEQLKIKDFFPLLFQKKEEISFYSFPISNVEKNTFRT